MTISPKRHGNQINTLVQVWTALNPGKAFSGLSLEEVRVGFQESIMARARVADAEAELSAAIGVRDAADNASWELYKRAINAIKADRDVHDRAEMYKALGIVERRSRRTSPRVAPVGPTPAMNPQTNVVKPAA